MEDTPTLLMMVLKQHFKNRSHILDEALQVVKEYSNHKLSIELYERALETLQEKMSDLPRKILLHFLTMVPLPKCEATNYKSPLLRDIDIDNYAPENVRGELLSFLNKETVEPSNELTTVPVETPKIAVEVNSDKLQQDKTVTFLQPKKVIHRRRKRKGKECENLLDICSTYVVKNQDLLNTMYKTKSKLLWDLVNSNRYEGEDKNILYSVMADVNRKQKLLRLVDCEDIPASVLYEEYGESDIFLKENHVYHIVNEDPFVISDELKNSVSNFVNR